MLVKSGHPHMLTVGPCCVEQVQEPRAEPARSSGLPHPSHALGSGRVTEAKEQWRRVATGCQSAKPSDHPHQVGLHLATGISPNVGGVVAVISDDFRGPGRRLRFYSGVPRSAPSMLWRAVAPIDSARTDCTM